VAGGGVVVAGGGVVVAGGGVVVAGGGVVVAGGGVVVAGGGVVVAGGGVVVAEGCTVVVGGGVVVAEDSTVPVGGVVVVVPEGALGLRMREGRLRHRFRRLSQPITGGEAAGADLIVRSSVASPLVFLTADVQAVLPARARRGGTMASSWVCTDFTPRRYPTCLRLFT
jgi:hypothetical protein